MLLRIVEDRELVARARRGDVESYNVLVSRWEKKLYNYLLRLTGNREDALDLAQEAFLKAYQGLGTLEEAEKFPPWLYRIAHNQALSKFRSDTRRGSEETESWPEREEGSGLPLAGKSVGLGSGRRVFPLELELIVERALEEVQVQRGVQDLAGLHQRRQVLLP